MLGNTAASQAALRWGKIVARNEVEPGAGAEAGERWEPTSAPAAASSPEVAAGPTPGDFDEAANLLSAIGDPVRLQILWSLGLREQNVTDLCALVGKRQQAVSHHLTILKLRRLVVLHRRGKSNFYSLTEQGREAMKAALPFLG